MKIIIKRRNKETINKQPFTISIIIVPTIFLEILLVSIYTWQEYFIPIRTCNTTTIYAITFGKIILTSIYQFLALFERRHIPSASPIKSCSIILCTCYVAANINVFFCFIVVKGIIFFRIAILITLKLISLTPSVATTFFSRFCRA